MRGESKITVSHTERICHYELDAQFRVVSVDQQWRDFGTANDAPELIPPVGPLGRSVLSCIADPTTAHLYQLLFERSRNTGKEISMRRSRDPTLS